MRTTIALVDSGCTCDDKSQLSVIGGMAFLRAKDNNTSREYDDFQDESGHGTACAAVIQRENPSVSLYIVKVLNTNLETDTDVLLKALEHLLYVDVKIINLSLAARYSSYMGKMERLCGALLEQNKIIVSSYGNAAANGYQFPATLPNVLGVRGNILIDRKFWYNPMTNDIVCDSTPVMVPTLPGNYRLFGGNSKATALFSGLLSRIFNEKPMTSIRELKEMLMMCAQNTTLPQNMEFPSSPNIDSRLNENERQMLKRVVSLFCNKLHKDYNQWPKDSLFFQGLRVDNCYDLIKELEDAFAIRISVEDLDFFSFYSLESLSYIVGGILYGA